MTFKLSLLVTFCYLAGSTFLTPVAGTRSLSLSVTGPATIENVKGMKVVTTLTNTGDETLKLVHSTNGILSTKPNDAFTVTDTDGLNVPYSGPSISDSCDEFTVLAPGESSEVSHDLSGLYGFSALGSGLHTYRIEAHQDFNHLDGEAGLVSVHTTSGPGHVISIIDNPTSSVSPRAPHSTYIGCSNERQRRIVVVMEVVKRLIISAYQFTSISGNFFSLRFVAWYGTYGGSRAQIVLHNWERMVAANLDTWVYDCGSCTQNVGATSNPTRYGEIALCPPFWVGNNLTFQTDTIMSHFLQFDSIVGTRIISGYDQGATKQLATRNPDQAITNTYSYVFYANNNPPL